MAIDAIDTRTDSLSVYAKSEHLCGWAQADDGTWTCVADYHAGSGCGRTWDPETGRTSTPRPVSVNSARDACCYTCGRAPTGTYHDGSPRYDHGHLPDGTTWEAPPPEEPPGPALARLMSREPFTARDGRTWDRWTFIAWPSIEGVRQTVELVGITGTRGRRHRAWLRATGESGWCRVLLDIQDGALHIHEPISVSRLSESSVARFLEMAEASDPENANDDDPMPEGWAAA